LVFAGRTDSPGVILIRFPASARHSLAEAVSKLVSDYAAQLVGAFVFQTSTAAVTAWARFRQSPRPL
jgi:Tfp pilus assembly protein PilF